MLKRLKQGEIVALITDAGMPGISDPGTALVSILLFSAPDDLYFTCLFPDERQLSVYYVGGVEKQQLFSVIVLSKNQFE